MRSRTSNPSRRVPMMLRKTQRKKDLFVIYTECVLEHKQIHEMRRSWENIMHNAPMIIIHGSDKNTIERI